jgi:hypothetical protein
MGNGRAPRPALGELGLGTGKKARLHRILYESLRFVDRLRELLSKYPS